VVDVRTNQVVLRVRGGATGIWPTELLFDRIGTPYLASGWRMFCQRHGIMAGNLLVFNFDGDHQIIVNRLRWRHVPSSVQCARPRQARRFLLR
jgi:hypothetical protein